MLKFYGSYGSLEIEKGSYLNILESLTFSLTIVLQISPSFLHTKQRMSAFNVISFCQPNKAAYFKFLCPSFSQPLSLIFSLYVYTDLVVEQIDRLSGLSHWIIFAMNPSSLFPRENRWLLSVYFDLTPSTHFTQKLEELAQLSALQDTNERSYLLECVRGCYESYISE